ncbi:MAG: DUF2867 domain-containing protein [Bacteroidota bacterium]
MIRKVKEERISPGDYPKGLLKRIDFADIFSTTNHTNSIQEITDLIFNTTPGWIKGLFAVRNKIVYLFGLKSEKPKDYNENYEVGGYVKFFKIFSISDNEVILGANDSHLNFRALVKNDKSDYYNIKVITLVEYNNLKGKIYMQLIKPFHRVVVKRMVKNAFRKERANTTETIDYRT